MDRDEFETAITQLAAAAQLLMSSATGDQRMTPFQLLAFFRLQQERLRTLIDPRTRDDELFKATAHAALSMAGRNEMLAAMGLLEQAQSLVQN